MIGQMELEALDTEFKKNVMGKKGSTLIVRFEGLHIFQFVQLYTNDSYSRGLAFKFERMPPSK